MKKQQPPKPEKTIDDFFSELETQNKTVADWARERKLDLSAVYAVTRGRTKGQRGDSREIVIAMGLTPPPIHGRRARNSAAAA